jgi:hypothetical protein
MKLIQVLKDYIQEILMFYPESRMFLFLFLISYLFGLLEEVGTYVSIGQIAILFVGLRSIKCMIEGGCHSDVYFFLFIFSLTNIILVVLHDYFLLIFPKPTTKFIKDTSNEKKKNSYYLDFSKELYNSMPFFLKR